MSIEKYTEVPTTFVGHEIIVNNRTMIWQNCVIHTGYCYLG